MKNNTMTYKEFVKEYAYWQLILTLLYRRLIFKCIEGVGYFDSVLLYWGLIAVTIVTSLIIYYERNRNMPSIFASTFFPLGIYTAVAYWGFFTTKIVILLSISAFLMILLAIAFFGRRIKNRERYWNIVFNRISNYIHGSKMVCAVLLAILVIPMTVNTMFGEPIYKSKIAPINGLEENQYTIANNIETISKLKKESWDTLDMKKRLDVLQTVANIEANYLGLSTELRVTAENLNLFTLGQYDDTTNQISINIEHLKNDESEEVLETLCHEAYHGYEKRLVDIYAKLSDEEKELRLFNDAASYDKEFADYKRDEGYFSQKVEMDSRAYAKDAVKDYYAKIDKYLNGEADDEETKTIEAVNNAIKEATGL